MPGPPEKEHAKDADGKIIDPRDRGYADSGWGIKPDDQPANAGDAGQYAVNETHYDPAAPDVVKEILRLQRRGFNLANRIVVEPGKLTIYDVNNDAFVVHGLSYGDPNLIEILKDLGVSFDPRQLAEVSSDDKDTREYPISRAWAWGAERSG
jgi:hypothetical protein